MKKEKKNNFFEKFALNVTKATGTTWAFVGALGVVILWGIAGPFFGYSENWQLVINTGTTIITFLMVFLIQKAQNKDSLAIQLKLNELVASSANASNRLVDVEDLSEEEMNTLRQYYCKLSSLTKNDNSLLMSHSIDEATERYAEKKNMKELTVAKKLASSAKKDSDKKGSDKKGSDKKVAVKKTEKKS